MLTVIMLCVFVALLTKGLWHRAGVEIAVDDYIATGDEEAIDRADAETGKMNQWLVVLLFVAAAIVWAMVGMQ